MPGHKIAARVAAWAVLALASAWLAEVARAKQQPHDFLSPAEADEVRNTPLPNDRVKLYLEFAGDRIKKFQYELQRKEAEPNRGELLDGLLENYASCMDATAEQLEDGRDRGLDMRAGIKELKKGAKENLTELQKIKSLASPYKADYSDSLDDAVESTQDALDAANSAAKEYGAVPIRRKP